MRDRWLPGRSRRLGQRLVVRRPCSDADQGRTQYLTTQAVAQAYLLNDAALGPGRVADQRQSFMLTRVEGGARGSLDHFKALGCQDCAQLTVDGGQAFTEGWVEAVSAGVGEGAGQVVGDR